MTGFVRTLCTGSLLAIASTLTGCRDLNCLVSGDNISGRIIFSEDVVVEKNKQVIIQSSSDSFLHSKSKTIENTQGLLTFAFSMCADAANGVIIRAFQDSNANGSYDVGEGSGRDDGTANGNAYWIPRDIPQQDNGYVRVGGVNIVLDSTDSI